LWRVKSEEYAMLMRDSRQINILSYFVTAVAVAALAAVMEVFGVRSSVIAAFVVCGVLLIRLAVQIMHFRHDLRASMIKSTAIAPAAVDPIATSANLANQPPRVPSTPTTVAAATVISVTTIKLEARVEDEEPKVETKAQVNRAGV
jgi:hypothetical protein